MKQFSGVPRPDLQWERGEASQLDLRGKQAAVVGGTAGLGRAVARLLASRGASVTVVGQTFRDQGTEGLTFLKADLSLMREAQRVAKALPAEQLDLLVFSNGIFATSRREATAEGLERDLAVSYLSRLVILREVAPRLGTRRADRTVKPRVFVFGFPGTDQKGTPDDFNSEKAYSLTTAHANTIVGNEALVLDTARRHPHLSVFGLNPGLIKTDIRAPVLGGQGSLRHRLVEWLIGAFNLSVDEYAERFAPLMASGQLEQHSGAMFNQKGLAILSSASLTPALVDQVLATSEALAARAAAAQVAA